MANEFRVKNGLIVGSLSVDSGGTLTIPDEIIHAGDTDNKIIFGTDSQGFQVNGNAIMGITDGQVTVDGSVTIKERAAAPADIAAYGQLWVKNTGTGQLFFTTDDGTDIQITTSSAVNASGGGGSPGGSDTFVQYNNGGSFGATTLSYDDTAGSEQFLFDDTSDQPLVKIVQRGSGHAFEVHDQASDSSIFTISEVGQVTIKTATPQAGGLTINDDMYVGQIKSSASGSASSPRYTFHSDQNTGMYHGGTDILGFSTAGTERMTISASGVVNIAGSLTVAGSAVGGISNVVEDTSPQLGGDLDTNGHDIIIDDGKGIYATAISNGLELMLFQHTASANSFIQVWNGIADSASGTLFGTDVVSTDTAGTGRMVGPGFEATGSTTDVGMSFRTKGLGHFTFFSDDTTSAAGPVINLMRHVDDNAVADDDILGQIKFMGGDSSMATPFLHDLRDYAKIESNLVDVTNGSADANIIISALTADSHTDYLEIGTNKTNDTSAGVRAYTGSMVTVSGTGTTALSRDTHAGAYVRATGAGTFTLWDDPKIGDQVVVISDHGGTTTIDGYSSDTINGAANTTITTQYNAKTFIATSTTTWIALG